MMLTSVVALCLAGGAMPATDADRLAALEDLVRQQGARIAELERQLAEAPAPTPAPALAPTNGPVVMQPSPAPAAQPASSPARLAISGDLRLRQEFNWGDRDGQDRSRNALRARLAARYALSDRIELGARLVTGNPDDPNSADVTLSDFADDFEVNLDQAFAKATFGPVGIIAGKFPNIVRRTDLLWDGDVNPQGLGIAYDAAIAPGLKLAARGLYFIVDENVAGRGGAMIGGQGGLVWNAGSQWSVDLSGAFYDYDLDYLAGADAGDFRSNRLTAGGRYLSDFDLTEALLKVGYGGLGPRWPVSATFDYVNNLGAADGQDTAYQGEIALGRTGHAGDLRLNYGYASTDVDAVLAAFAQDNIPLGSGYRLHSVGAAYTLSPALRLEALLYHFRARQADPPSRDWQDRARLNMVFEF